MQANNGLIFKVLRTSAEQLNLSTGDKMILLVLLNHWNPRRSGSECWPGQPRIASHAGLSVRSVQYGLHRIEQMGYIKSTLYPGQTTRFQIHADVIAAVCTPAPDAPTPATGAGVPLQEVRDTPATRAPTPAPVADECLSNALDNSLRHSRKQSRQSEPTHMKTVLENALSGENE